MPTIGMITSSISDLMMMPKAPPMMMPTAMSIMLPRMANSRNSLMTPMWLLPTPGCGRRPHNAGSLGRIISVVGCRRWSGEPYRPPHGRPSCVLDLQSAAERLFGDGVRRRGGPGGGGGRRGVRAVGPDRGAVWLSGAAGGTGAGPPRVRVPVHAGGGRDRAGGAGGDRGGERPGGVQASAPEAAAG